MTEKELFQDYYSNEDVAKLMGIEPTTLANRISAGGDHPPFTGRGENRRFPKDAFKRWETTKLTHARKKRA